ncbi:hypothetical protein OY671_009646, partial [Metschnikowia pulcherrima]
VAGGATRQLSVRAASEALEADAPDSVSIHDAARPDSPESVIAASVEASTRHEAAIPVLPVVDSLVRGGDGMMSEPARREGLYRVQTPQAFRYPVILAAHRAWQGEAEAGDDAQVAVAAGHAVASVQGEERSRKVTFASDSRESDLQENAVTIPFPRTGSGFDVHRLVPGEESWLCGSRIDHTHGSSGHSDADVAIHASV